MSGERWLGDIQRIVSVSSIVVLMLILSMSSATATSTSISIGSTDTTVGKSVTLPLMIENADEEISCVTILLSYNSAIAQVTSVSNSGFDAFVYNPDNAQGRTTIVAYQTGETGLQGTIKIADVTVKAISAGSSSLNLQIETLKNNAGATVSADVISGSFTAKSSGGNGGNGGNGGSTPTSSPTPTPSPTPSTNVTITPSPSPSPSQPAEPGIVTVQVDDVTVERGELATITITIKGVGGKGLSSALIDLTYDPKIVKVVSAENSNFDEFMPSIEKGEVRMVGYQAGAEGLKGDVLFAEIQVKAVGKTGESSGLELEVKGLMDNVGKELKEHEDFNVEDGSFMIASIVAAGSTPVAEEPSKPLIPTVGVVGTIAVIVGSYFVIRLRRRQ